MDTNLQNQIINELGLSALAPEQQEEAILRMGKIIFQAVMIRVMEELDDSAKDEFDKLLTQKLEGKTEIAEEDEKEILAFLQSKIANFDEIVNEEVLKFKQDSVDFMKKLNS